MAGGARGGAARRRRRAGDRQDERRPTRRRPDPRDRRQRHVRQGSAAGGARRACRPRAALRQGPARDHARRPGAGGGARTGRPARCAGGLDVRRRCRPARRWPPVRCAGRAQLAAARPDLTFAELRGNVDTRLEKASQFDAIVLAAAGLDRLGRGDRITERLDTGLMLPMVGQGALAIECRADDDATRERLAAIDDVDAAHRGARRARVPRRARRRLLAAVRGVRDRRRRLRVGRRVARRARRERGRARAAWPNADPVQGGHRSRRGDLRRAADASCSPRDRLPRRRRARGSGAHHRARRRRRSHVPTSSSTTGSPRPRCWTSRPAAPS